MKKCFLLAITLLLCSTLPAIQPEKIDLLSAKAVLSNTDGYYVLSDNTCWRVFSFSKRRRSLREWWNNVQLAPEIFNCAPNDWNVGSQVEVYSKCEFLGIPEENAANKTIIKNCSHVFVNSQTGQVLFGNALETADCIVQVFKEAQRIGYDAGHAAGYDSGHSAGYSEGHTIGYSEGYSEGHAAGYSEGYSIGYAAGDLQGCNRGQCVQR